MGLMDRDYMREAARERTSHGDGSGPSPIVYAAIGAIAALAVGFGYRGMVHGEPTRMGPMVVTVGSTQVSTPAAEPRGSTTDGMDAQPPVALVAPAEPEIVAPVGMAPDMQDAPRLEVQTFPESGAVQWVRPPSPDEQLVMMRISDGSGITGSKVLRLRDIAGNVVAQVYVRDQEGAIIQIPPGYYQINVMIGRIWHGVRYQFGDDALYLRGSVMRLGTGGGDYMLLPQGTSGADMRQIPPSRF